MQSLKDTWNYSVANKIGLVAVGLSMFCCLCVLIPKGGSPATVIPTRTELPELSRRTVITSAPPINTPASNQTEAAHVVRVVDGDTIKVSLNGREWSVRYIGMNTPEKNQVCGDAATQANAALVADQEVVMVKDVSETDRYGRLLRYVYVNDVFVNAELVRQGYAEAATYPPDVAHVEEFQALVATARSANLGCWATSVWSDAAVIPTAPPSNSVTQASSGEAVCNCGGPDLDCKDFGTHAAAQACFEYCQGQGFGNVFQLDGNSDGQACESLP